MARTDDIEHDQTQRLENLRAMGKRLADAIAQDIAALEKGAFDKLRTTDPEISRLCAHYAREIAALKAQGGIRGISDRLRSALKKDGAHLKALLLRHGKLVACMREASEGLVQAIAGEVERVRTQGAPYKAKPQAKRSTAGAILYNNVV